MSPVHSTVSPMLSLLVFGRRGRKEHNDINKVTPVATFFCYSVDNFGNNFGNHKKK